MSLRWYLGYDLDEPLPDHSSLTRIRDRYGLEIFTRFFEQVVEWCVEAGLVWGEEFYFDATKVEANASMDSLSPRFAVESHLENLFEPEPFDLGEDGDAASVTPPSADHALPSASDEELAAANASRSDWISREGRQNRAVVRNHYRRKSDYRVSRTDPDASFMRPKAGSTRLGYHAHYVADGGKARVILAALVTPAEVMENQPMLDLLWRTCFRWRAWPHQVTGDTTYGTLENIVGIEKANIRAYVSMANFDDLTPYFGPSNFVYDPEQDLYRCPQEEPLYFVHNSYTLRLRRYRAEPETCNSCPLKAKCTPSDRGRIVSRSFDEEYLDRVRAYRETFPYEKALRKRKVWIEPLFAEAKDWHGLRRFRLRGLKKVNSEALLIAAGQNMKRLVAAQGLGPRKPAQVDAGPPPAPVGRCRTHSTGQRPSRLPNRSVFQQPAGFS